MPWQIHIQNVLAFHEGHGIFAAFVTNVLPAVNELMVNESEWISLNNI
jgi:hypothetical protein